VAVELDAETGCLVIASPFVSADGDRFVTGDRAVISGDGTFQLLGRADRVIKVGERRLSLPDMEDRLREHASVDDVALLALEKGGDSARVAAVVVPSPAAWDAVAAGGRRSLAKTLSEYLAAHFERVLLPRAWRFTSALPRNPQGKIPHDALRALFGAEAPPCTPERLAIQRSARALEERVRIPWDLAFLDGHFPGNPIVAGVVQVHFAMRALEELLGEAPGLAALEELKFHAVLSPGQEAILRVEIGDDGSRFRFSLADAADAQRLFASGRGRLEART
jgi:AMP-binding enzyme C-terminal domain